MNMAGVNLENDGLSWVDFCDSQAKVAATDFVKSLYSYLGSNIPEGGIRSSIPYKDFVSKFVDCFIEHFDIEITRKNNLKLKVSNGLPTGHLNHISSATFLNNSEECSDYSEHEVDFPTPKPQHKPFFRRLSFKGLRKGKAFFHKQNSDEVELSSLGHDKHLKQEKHSKTKLAKIVVECRKEGIVNYLLGENMDGTQKWEKCRLALIKTVGGYMLEFYSPPKSVKPKSGVFCFLITEARETTALEMPDHENTFVLKAENNMEYVIEAHDSDDMRSWLATVKYCMRSNQQSDDMDSRSLFSQGNDTYRLRSPLSKPSASTDIDSATEDPPELPPRLQTVSNLRSETPVLRLSSNSNFELCSSHNDISQSCETEFDLSVTLRHYPWFHGTLPRSDAAMLVLHGGTTGHGVFLVRQSETRKGEFVLTFNFHGRAKHLRMTLNDQGQCRVQHLWFPTIFDMLEHFRQHPIPLESGGTADVTLTEYVVVPVINLPVSQAGTLGSPPAPERRPPDPPEPRDITTLGGSIRTRTESMERLPERIERPERQNVSGGSLATNANRAIENTYSFV
uniref:SH2 domain-containing protein n=1 Tax=Clastoptera arizonana TaxID=38151 RepID=A0A1B6DIC9_9HEMI